MGTALLVSVLALAQLPEDPADIGFVHYLKDGQLVALEAQRSQKRNARGFNTSRKSLVIDGYASPIRFRQGELPEFVVTVLLPMQLPTNWELHPLLLHGERQGRSLTIMDDGPVDALGSPGYHLRVRRYGPNSYRLIPTDTLPPGEYAFKYGLTPYESKDLYCFGIDVRRPRPLPVSNAGRG